MPELVVVSLATTEQSNRAQRQPRLYTSTICYSTTSCHALKNVIFCSQKKISARASSWRWAMLVHKTHANNDFFCLYFCFAQVYSECLIVFIYAVCVNVTILYIFFFYFRSLLMFSNTHIFILLSNVLCFRSMMIQRRKTAARYISCEMENIKWQITLFDMRNMMLYTLCVGRCDIQRKALRAWLGNVSYVSLIYYMWHVAMFMWWNELHSGMWWMNGCRELICLPVMLSIALWADIFFESFADNKHTGSGRRLCKDKLNIN